MFDWQTIAVALIILAALAYAGRRALARLLSFRAGAKGAAAGCATGCGGCGEGRKDSGASPPALVSISPTRTTPRRGPQ